MNKFPRLFEPIRIGNLLVPNRIVHEPTDTSSSHADGSVSARDLSHHETLAKGGTGLIIVGATTPSARLGRPTVTCLVADGDNYIPGLARLAEGMHRYGAKCWIQLQHPGPKASIPRDDMFTTNDRVSKLFWGSGRELVRADSEAQGTVARAMSTDEVLEMVELFSEAAWRVMQAGFDGVQLHAAHGYLISDFMSPYLNMRSDRFGGSFENRMRFPLAIIADIQKKCGRDFPISVRFNAIEFVPGGRDIEECLKTALRLQEAGVASLDLSTSGAPSVGLDPMYMKEGWTLYISEAVKKAVAVPVMISHSLRNPEFCERALAEGKTDLIGLSRQMLADPFWPLKAYYGKEKKIRRCISCLEGCWQASILAKREIKCSINPACGNEAFDRLAPAGKALSLAVVGGGPAGMEAARIAALRGHRVTLFEKTAELGGAILGCCQVEGKEKMKWYADWVREEIKDLGVETRLNCQAGPAELKNFDAVVNATGARSVRPQVPGGDAPNVVGLEEVMACPKVSCEYHPKNGRVPVKTGERVLIWGDHYPAADTAAHLARMGKDVTIVTSAPAFGRDIEVIHLAVLRKIFARKEVEALELRPFKHEVKIITGAELIAVEKDAVTLIDTALKTRKIAADTLVCCRVEPENGLAAALAAAGIPYVSVGDAVRPRNLHAAVKEGAEAGRIFEEKLSPHPNGAPVDRLPLEIRSMMK